MDTQKPDDPLHILESLYVEFLHLDADDASDEVKDRIDALTEEQKDELRYYSGFYLGDTSEVEDHAQRSVGQWLDGYLN